MRRYISEFRQKRRDQALLRPVKGQLDIAKIEPSTPVVVAGLFRTPSGVGEVARLQVKWLQSLNFDPVCVDLSGVFGQIEMPAEVNLSMMPEAKKGVLFLHLNAPEVRTGLHYLQVLKTYRPDWHIIGFWCWELEMMPQDWISEADYLSELWVLSDMMADTFRPFIDIPIRVMPPKLPASLAAPTSKKNARAWLRKQTSSLTLTGQPGLVAPTEDDFICLALADGRSSFRRKNLSGAIAAFLGADLHNNNGRLIIKTRNLKEDAQEYERITKLAQSCPQISLIDTNFANHELLHLLQSCDVYLSLHRAEGFGLVIAQALQFGKPVIATNWGGLETHRPNANFHAVSFELVSLEDVEYGPYALWNGLAKWAEPNIEEASQILRQLQSTNKV